MTEYDIIPKVTAKLIVKFNFKQQNDRLQYGECPHCGKKSLWTLSERPIYIQCYRTRDCGYTSKSYELFPSEFDYFDRRYPITDENHHAAADAYLDLLCGFDLDKINGFYSQDSFTNPYAIMGGSSSIRFYLDDDKKHYWEHLIDPVKICKEGQRPEILTDACSAGGLKGQYWQPPGQVLEKKDKVYLVNGIFDAISVYLSGHKVVALLSDSLPKKLIKTQTDNRIKWIISVGSNDKYRKDTKKHAWWLQDNEHQVGALFYSDDNSDLSLHDLYQMPGYKSEGNLLTKDHIKKYGYYGSLELAKNYSEKAMLMHAETEKPYFIFQFKNNTYSMKYDESKYRVALVEAENRGMGTDDENHDFAWGAASTLKNIATFSRQFLYFQQPDSGEEGQFFFKFDFANGAPSAQIALPGRTLTTAGEYTKSTFNLNPSAIYNGSSGDLMYENKKEMSSVPKIVKTLDFIGYDRASAAYIYHDFAVENGRVIEVNKESFFQLRKTGIKTMVDMKQELNTELNTEWLQDYKTAYGPGGMVALTCWFGGLYAEQMREHHRSFPFTAIIGEAGSGKSDMISFLWKLIGREAESFNPAIGSVAGRIRNMSQYANLPLIFNEVDNEQISRDTKTKRFDWNEYKDLFEGQFGRFTGKKTQGNEVRKPKFKGFLFITQNISVMASEAIMSRIIHLQFDRTHHSEAGKHASDRLLALPIKEVSGFLLHANKRAKEILALFDEKYPIHAATIRAKGSVKLERIIHNHAQMMAFADCLALILSLSKADVAEVQATFVKMAGERQLSLNADHAIVASFWDMFDYIDGGKDESGSRANKANHARFPEDEIWINIPDFMRHCDNAGQPRIDESELQRHLKGSHLYKFVETKVAYSRIDKRTMRMWVFKRH